MRAYSGCIGCTGGRKAEPGTGQKANPTGS